MPDAATDEWVLIFSDGTGQRGVRDDADRGEIDGVRIKGTNVFWMFSAAEGKPGLATFYDPGLGAPEEGSRGWRRAAENLWSQATGWGITANITDCYDALLAKWRPGMKIGLFGFSRGAYTVRCVSGVLSACGLATTDGAAAIDREKEGPGAERRRQIADEAVAAYELDDKAAREAAGAAFARKYASAPVVPDVIGVFDTVESLGLPGVTNMVNPFKHRFHNKRLSPRVRIGLHALSIDENRKAFAPVLWDDPDAQAGAAGQIIEQCWFPGVHSDIGGGYEEKGLSDLALAWMLKRLHALAGLRIPLDEATLKPDLHADAHNERTGMGVAWWPAERNIRGETADIAALCAKLEDRFERLMTYRPRPLSRHPRMTRFYGTSRETRSRGSASPEDS